MFEILSICKGGGYQYCRTEPPHPNRNSKGLYPLHRVLMENELGRLLRTDEHVHHINEVKTDDRIENLELKTRSDHAKHHRPSLPKIEMPCACGKTFLIRPHIARQRISRTKGPILCSRECHYKYRDAIHASFGNSN